MIVKYSTSVNHYTSLNLTKLDILDGLKEIKVAVGYRVDGEELESFPGEYPDKLPPDFPELGQLTALQPTLPCSSVWSRFTGSSRAGLHQLPKLPLGINSPSKLGNMFNSLRSLSGSRLRTSVSGPVASTCAPNRYSIITLLSFSTSIRSGFLCFARAISGVYGSVERERVRWLAVQYRKYKKG